MALLSVNCTCTLLGTLEGLVAWAVCSLHPSACCKASKHTPLSSDLLSVVLAPVFTLFYLSDSSWSHWLFYGDGRSQTQALFTLFTQRASQCLNKERTTMGAQPLLAIRNSTLERALKDTQDLKWTSSFPWDTGLRWLGTCASVVVEFLELLASLQSNNYFILKVHGCIDKQLHIPL